MKPETSTLDVVSEQFDKLAGEASGEPESLEPAADTSADPAEAAAEPSAGDRTRDEGGRFVAKKPGVAAKSNDAPRPTSSGAQARAEPGAPGGPAAPEQAAPAVPTAPVLPELKPPQDWRAAAREKWAAMPREAQEEALRLYGETRKTLDRAAALEKEIDPWRAATQPYSHLFGGVPPHQVIGGLLRSLSVLQTGHPQQRAQVAASIVRDYLGTDEGALSLLANAIHGGGSGEPVQAPQAMSPEQIRHLARQEWEAAQQQSARDAAVKTWSEFESATPEFLSEPGFRQRLAAELQISLHDKQGAMPTKEDIQKAYNAACQAHPVVSKIVNQRKEAAAANARRVSTPAAAAGIKNEPAGPGGGGKAKNTEEEVARQYDRLTRPARV